MNGALGDTVAANVAGQDAARKALATIDDGSSHPDQLHVALMEIWAEHGSPGLVGAHRAIQKAIERRCAPKP